MTAIPFEMEFKDPIKCFVFRRPQTQKSCEDSKHMKRLHIYNLYYTSLVLYPHWIFFDLAKYQIGRATGNEQFYGHGPAIYNLSVNDYNRQSAWFRISSYLTGTKHTCSYFIEIQNCCACSSGSKVKLKIWAWNWPDRKLTWTHVKVLSSHSHSAILYKMLWTWKHRNMQEDVLDNYFLSKMWPMYLVTASVAADKNCDSKIDSRRLRREYWLLVAGRFQIEWSTKLSNWQTNIFKLWNWNKIIM